MRKSYVAEAITFAEKSNADLQPELMTAEDRRALLAEYTRLKKLAAYGETVLAPTLDDPGELAKVTGTSVGRAKATIETAKALRDADEVADAFAEGDISLDQAGEIARAEKAKPGSATELLETAETQSFQVLKERSRKVVLEAEQRRGLGERQREARTARSYSDELGMINFHLRLQPHVGTSIVNRAEAEAQRLFKAAKKEQRQEPFERHLADAYAAMLDGSPARGSSRRAELVVLVSHEVAKRGWTDVKDGEVCKIPGVGPVPPEVAREIAEDAFLTGVFYDGKDLRKIKRWTRSTPVEVKLALQLGKPPEFDGIKCVDCGKRFRTEEDHVDPHCAGGPASADNLDPRCKPCHKAKTERDRQAGKLRPRKPEAKRDRRAGKMKARAP